MKNILNINTLLPNLKILLNIKKTAEEVFFLLKNVYNY